MSEAQRLMAELEDAYIRGGGCNDARVTASLLATAEAYGLTVGGVLYLIRRRSEWRDS